MKTFLLLALLLLGTDSFAQFTPAYTGLQSTSTKFISTSQYLFAATSGVGANTGVYRSSDNGSNWIRCSEGLPFGRPQILTLAIDKNVIYSYAVGFNGNAPGLYKSTDQGDSWSITSLTASQTLSLHVKGDTVFAGGFSTGVYRSTNAGANWTEINTGFPSNAGIYAFLRIDSIIYVGMYQNGVYKSTDWGGTWISVSSGLPSMVSVSALQYFNGAIYAGTLGNGIYKSTNNGLNWISANTPEIENFAVNGFAVHNNVLVMSNTNFGNLGVQYTYNGGAAWIPAGQGITNGSINAVYNYNGFLFAATSATGSSVYRRPLSQLTSVQNISSEVPSGFKLSQNYPNPFNPTTSIEFSLPKAGMVALKVYDINGREAAELIKIHNLNAGEYKADFNASGLTSGVYFYTLSYNGFNETKKMLLVK